MYRLIINDELNRARNKILLAQEKCRILPQTGAGSRSPESKYWREQLDRWQDYANELTQLKRNHDIVLLGKTLLASGKGYHIAVMDANQSYTIKNFPHKKLPTDIRDKLPVVADYRGNNPDCARCGASGTELHHWAPRHLFEDADQWPTSYLCNNCHKLWHDTIVKHWRPGNGHNA